MSNNINIEIGNVLKVTVDKNGVSSAMTLIVTQKAEDNLTCLELSSAKLMSKDEKNNIEIKKSDGGLKFNSYVNVSKPLSLDLNSDNKIIKYNMQIPQKDINKIVKKYKTLKNVIPTPINPINEFEYMENMIKEQIEKFKTNPQYINELLLFKSKFEKYSIRNTFLIFSQNPNATFVATYTDWKNKFNTTVRKNEKGITIFRPQTDTFFIKDNKYVDIKKATNEDKEKITKGEYELSEETTYKPMKVFDISQTKFPVEKYPVLCNMGYENIECKELYEIIKEFSYECSIPVMEQELNTIELKGFYSVTDSNITINSLLGDTAKIDTLCHELAHAVLHKGTNSPIEIKEFEAECLAVMLNHRFNIDVSDNSIRYIQKYFKNIESKNPDNLKDIISKSFERLKKEYTYISEKIQEKIINEYPHIYEKQLIKENLKTQEQPKGAFVLSSDDFNKFIENDIPQSKEPETTNDVWNNKRESI